MVAKNVRKFLVNPKKQKKHKVSHTGKAANSDHNTQFIDLDLKIENLKPTRDVFFNFKNKEGLKTFKNITSDTTEFSDCFESTEP